MNNSKLEYGKKHGVILLIASGLIFFSLFILSQGWVDGWSFMRNLDRLYILQFEGEYRGDPDTYIRTKYLLVLCFGTASYGLMMFLEVVNSPFLLLFRRLNKDESSIEKENES